MSSREQKLLSVRWIMPVLAVFFVNHFLRVVLHLCDGGRASYIVAILNPLDDRSRLWAELLIVACLSFAIHWVQRPGWWPTVTTTVAFLLFYVTNYVHFVFLNRPPSVATLGELPEFLTVIPLYWAISLSVILLLLAAAFLFSLRWPGGRAAPFLLLCLLGFGFAAYSFPARAVDLMDSFVRFDRIRRDKNFYHIGSLFSLARMGLNDRRISLALETKVFGPSQWPFADVDAAVGSIKERRNIHMVLLESHLDPKDFVGVQFEREPWDPRYRDWRDTTQSRVVSPVFGGATANAEFEMLCGVPAYQFLNPIVFNDLEGTVVPCLPSLLGAIGYHTVASTPVSETFFRARDAYQSLGFSEMHFEDGFDMSDLDGWHLSTRSTLRQALEFSRERAPPDAPVFNYVVSMAGHTPFTLNPDRRPPVVELSSELSWVAGVVNHSYYTSVAIADYLDGTRRTDSDAIVIFYSDHVPPQPIDDYRVTNYMGTRERSPELELYLMPILVFDRGVPVQIGTVPNYLMPEIIINLLSDGDYCANHPCLHRRQHLLRPPHVFDRNRPTRYECTIHDSHPQPACETAGELHTELVESFYSLIKQARLHD